MRTIVLLLFSLSALFVHAQEHQDQPVRIGGHSILWYSTPKNFLNALEERRAFVKVLKIRDNWIYVELYHSERIAAVMHLASLVENNSEAGRRFLSETGESREEFLKELAAEPLTDKQRTILWINLDQVEAVTDQKIPKIEAEPDQGD